MNTEDWSATVYGVAKRILSKSFLIIQKKKKKDYNTFSFFSFQRPVNSSIFDTNMKFAC